MSNGVSNGDRDDRMKKRPLFRGRENAWRLDLPKGAFRARLSVAWASGAYPNVTAHWLAL